MATNTKYPHIEKPPEEPARLKRLPRVRIAQIVLDYLAYGQLGEKSWVFAARVARHRAHGHRTQKPAT